MSTVIVLRDEQHRRFIVGHDSMLLYDGGDSGSDPSIRKLVVWPEVAIAYSGDIEIPYWLDKRIRRGELSRPKDWRNLRVDSGPLYELCHVAVMFPCGALWLCEWNWYRNHPVFLGPYRQVNIGLADDLSAETPRDEKWVHSALQRNASWGCREPFRVCALPFGDKFVGARGPG